MKIILKSFPLALVAMMYCQTANAQTCEVEESSNVFLSFDCNSSSAQCPTQTNVCTVENGSKAGRIVGTAGSLGTTDQTPVIARSARTPRTTSISGNSEYTQKTTAFQPTNPLTCPGNQIKSVKQLNVTISTIGLPIQEAFVIGSELPPSQIMAARFHWRARPTSPTALNTGFNNLIVQHPPGNTAAGFYDAITNTVPGTVWTPIGTPGFVTIHRDYLPSLVVYTNQWRASTVFPNMTIGSQLIGQVGTHVNEVQGAILETCHRGRVLPLPKTRATPSARSR
jgi:hypothetical protein